MPLTDVRIRSLKPADKPHKYSDGGLFLFIPPSDSKLWRMAYRFEGKSRLLSFGAYPAVSLKDARERRDEARLPGFDLCGKPELLKGLGGKEAEAAGGAARDERADVFGRAAALVFRGLRLPEARAHEENRAEKKEGAQAHARCGEGEGPYVIHPDRLRHEGAAPDRRGDEKKNSLAKFK